MTNPLKVRAILTALDSSIGDLSVASGLSGFYLSRLLNGKIRHPTRKTRRKLATGLKELIKDHNVI